MKRFNKAFTLTELLIALGVIGILCAILLPVIFNLLPNQNTIMAKRAYYTVQTVVADMINDESCYPDKTSASGTNRRYGFDDGFGYSNCLLWGGEEHTNTINTEGNANLKFGTLFTDKLDLSGDATTSTSGATFQTKDGMSWKMNQMTFSGATSKDAWAVIIVDVNGPDSPNCGQSTNANVDLGDGGTVSCNGVTKGYDRFAMAVYNDGRITINSNDKWAVEAVKVNKDITEE